MKDETVAVMNRTARQALSPRVDRRAVHKHDSTNVWLRGTCEGATSVEYEIPSAGRPVRFADVMEVQRQAGIFFSHDVLGIPHDHVFILERIRLDRRSSDPLQPLDDFGTVQVHLSERTSRRSALTFDLDTTGSGSAVVRFVSREVYSRLRESGAARQTGPGWWPSETSSFDASGRIDLARDDVLLVDHQGDHLSAMGVILAIEDAIIASSIRSQLQSLDVEFISYVEWAGIATYAMSWLTVESFEGMILQDGVVRARFAGRASGSEVR